MFRSLAVTVFLVVLCGSDALLSDVGKCTFMEYYCSALNCNTRLVKAMQKDPNGDCGAKFQAMLSCIKSVLKYCVGDSLSDSQIDDVVQLSFKEDAVCLEGSFEVPTVAPGASLPCTNAFVQNAPLCGKTFHEKFVADKADPSLCSEYAKAKKCINDLISSDCSFSSDVLEVLNLALSDYNPYCDSNRDPGASGKGICYGVKTFNGAGKSSYVVPGLLVAALTIHLLLV